MAEFLYSTILVIRYGLSLLNRGEVMQPTQPIVEVLSIGTELLLGQILDTNSQFLTQELAQLGLNCYWHSTVGDNKDRIKQSLSLALDRADVVLTSGGLGPTADDLTIESMAEFFSVPLVFDQEVMDDIAHKFAKRGISMPQSNRKQAMRPEGSQILPNKHGTAPGIIWQLSEAQLAQKRIKEPAKTRTIITFPGVPSELVDMWKSTARPYLAQNFSAGSIWSCDLKHYGIGESALAELYADLLNSTNPTVAPLAGSGECRLRVTAKATNEDAARVLAAPVIESIERKSGKLLYGKDGDSLESVVGAMLLERKMILAVAESCTGGLVSKRLTDNPGSSAYIKLNVISYSNEAKKSLLGVNSYILRSKGAVSNECAHAMATGVKKVAGADIGLSITGIAGPGGGSDEKPVGLVYLALVSEHFQTDKELRFSADLSRQEIRHRSANEALNLVRLFLLDQLD